MKFETLTAVTHLLITKFVLKLAGICGFCNVNILTVRSTIHHTGMLSGDVTRLPAAGLRVDKKAS